MNMKVILREDVHALGKAGEVVEVKRGFGRNYLVPQNKALIATTANLRHLEHEKTVALARKAKLKGVATDAAKKLEAQSVTIARRVGENDKLFGSVTAIDIAEALAQAGAPIDRHLIHLAEPIKALGEVTVDIKLHGEVTAKVKVNVVAEKQ
jgi:large subunit ribosomal protein L9